MSYNTDLFLFLNGPPAPAASILLGVRLIAGSPVIIAPLLLVWLWVRHPDQQRAGLLAVALSVLVGQGINLVLGALWFEPRPFMVGIGNTLVVHIADNGFPSDHSTLMFALGTGLILTRAARIAGLFVCMIGLGVAWARVYLGVHFPIDVLTGILVGAAAGWLACRLEPSIARYFLPWAERLYEFLLATLRLPAVVFPRRVQPTMKSRPAP